METALMLRQVFQKYVLYCINTFAALECSFIDSQVELLVPDLSHCLIARHNLLPRNVREPLGNIAIILFALFARRFSREIFLVTATSISLLLSPILLAAHPSRFNALFSSRPRHGASETFPSLSRLFTFTLWSRLTARHSVSIVAQHPAEHPCISPPPALSDSPSFLFMHRREHSQSQYIKFPVCVCRLPLGKSFCVRLPRRHVIFP